MDSATPSKRLLDVEIILGTVATLLYFSNVISDKPSFWATVALKPIPVLFMIVWAYRNGQGLYRNFIVAGLSCAMVGDVVLVWKSNEAFLWGLFINLIAHLVYIAGFSFDNRKLKLARLIPYALFSGGMFWFLLPNLGAMTWPVLAYVIAITAMMWRAAARVGHTGVANRSEWAATIGAILFAACDVQIALNRFHRPIDGVVYTILTSYWLGQAGIAWSVKDRT